MAPAFGVLALQGDFAEHIAVLEGCSVAAVEVRTRDQLETVDALIIPGGESTTILKLMDRFDLRDPLVKRIEQGLPVFGTCAGGIVLAARVGDGETPLGVLDVRVVRNAYGRQVDSFEAELEVARLGPVRGVFIRAPVFEEVGEGVEVLALLAGRPVLVRSGRLLASTFHPELTGDLRLHQYFIREVCGASGGA